MTTTGIKRRNFIYGLYCVCENCGDREEVRYVGQTTQELGARLYGHTYMLIYRERHGLSLSYSQNWIKKHGGENIKILVLEELESPEELDEAEERWIKSLEGLTNIKPGGPATRGWKMPVEVAESRRGAGNPMYGRDRSELMDRLRKLRGPMSAKNRARVAKTLKKALEDPEVEARRIEGIRRSHNTPEFKKYASDRMMGANNPNYGKSPTEEVKRKTALAMSPFSEDDIRSIRKRREEGEMMKDIATSFGVDPSTISRIANRKRFDWIED